MSKQFWAVIIVIVLVFVGIFALTGNKNKSPSTSSSSQPTNNVIGLGKANVTLVEYGDFQCPYCGEYYPTLKQVQSEYNDQIFFQFRNFPVVSVHQNAFAGARAAEAAAQQGQFWQMHDLLYDQNDQYYASNQAISTWINASDPETFFEQYASQLGLNVKQFETDYASTKVNDLINADMAVGNKLNVQGTPTFFIDGKQVTIANTVAAFEKVINAEIAKKAPATTGTATP